MDDATFDSTIPLLDPSITELHLHNNELTQIKEDAFQNLRLLTDLNIGMNDIATVSPLAFRGTIIRSLSLASNQLTSFPDLSSIASTIMVIDLYRNQISQLPSDAFANMAALNSIDIPDNFLTSCPDFSSLPATNTLKNLNLNNNEISTI
ncbi:hypothetical protein CAPTEDRAFT_91102, partial [Capitella teleta]